MEGGTEQAGDEKGGIGTYIAEESQRAVDLLT